ncbi:MAG: PspC domain protein, partial [Ilumatobacteraceae bacterium]|nr:PspC domain protein [Ilumatobacteraceae bacterium]
PDRPVADGIGSVGAVGVVDPAARRPAVPRRRRRPLGLAAIGAGALFAGFAALLDAAGAWHPTITLVAMIALGIAIAGLMVSAVFNRSVIGVPVILVLGALLSFLAVTRPQLEGGAGERTVVVTDPTESSRTERLGAGRLTIDLRDAQSATYQLVASVGFGRLDVIVPADAALHLRTDVGAGAVRVDGRDLVDGIRVVDERNLPPSSAATPTATNGTAVQTLDLTLEVGGGAIVITHVP